MGLPRKEALLESLVAPFAWTAFRPNEKIIKIAPVKP